MSNQRGKLEQEHLSYSQLSEYAQCPRKYYYRRIAKVPARPAYALVSGKAMHEGLERHNLELLQGNHTTQEDIIEAGVEHIRQCPEGDDLEVPRLRIIDLFVREARPAIGAYLKDAEPKILDSDIMGIVEEVSFELAGLPCVGYIDLHTSNGVWDYKFVGRRKSEKEVAVDPQLVLYKHVTGATQAGLVCLVRESPVAQAVEQPHDESIQAGVMDWANSVAKAIAVSKESGVWCRADPRAFTCGQTCPFYFHCYRKETCK